MYPSNDTWKVNGLEVTTINGMSDWVKLADDISTVSNFSVTANAGNRSASLTAVKVGNQRLVDGNTTLTFPSSNGFDCFETGDVVQDPDVKVISKDEDANTITVDGGKWSDGTDIVGDIIPMTDKGFYYDDPNIDPNYGDPQPIFDPGINSNYTLIRRDHAWTEFEFVTPINVTSAVHLQGGAYYAGKCCGFSQL